MTREGPGEGSLAFSCPSPLTDTSGLLKFEFLESNSGKNMLSTLL